MNIKKFLLIVFIIPNMLLSQNFFLLDSLKTQFKVNEYTLETQDLYAIKKNINLYNVYASNNTILLISILPDLDETVLPRMDQKGTNWQIVNFDNIQDKILSKSKVEKMILDWIETNTPDKKTLEYQLIKKENGNYYVSKTCLTEVFSIGNSKPPLISPYGTINIEDQKVTIKEMEKSFKLQFPSKDFIMDVRNNNLNREFNIPYIFRNYLSKEYTINGSKAYQFWTFDGWWIHDGYDEHRGIDRFLYIPNKGIVGGSFDFYFKLKPKISSNKYFTVSTDVLWKNIINENIMVAKELR